MNILSIQNITYVKIFEHFIYWSRSKLNMRFL